FSMLLELSMTTTSHSPRLSISYIDPATPELHTLSLHDALPISMSRASSLWRAPLPPPDPSLWARGPRRMPPRDCSLPNESSTPRSEEHTSELQSRGHLVCRLLLEKKKCSWRSLDP